MHDDSLLVSQTQTLPQVRASSLQELVYKQGQAGITKATVSIVFNNEDKPNSPVGFDHDDRITVTRQVPVTFCHTSHMSSSTAPCSHLQPQ